ncbi:MAG: hypothetical protein WBV57_01840 [Methanoregula sp.]
MATKERFLAFAAASPADQKREDAIVALEYIRDLAEKSASHH